MYPLKSTVSISIYRKTKITKFRVEHQTLEILETGIIDSRQQSQCYINTTRRKTRPQDAQTLDAELHRTEKISRFSSDINPHCAFTSANFRFKMFQVTFWSSPIRFFSTIFFLRF